MNCQECLARYSEFVDDAMDGESASQWRSHLERCPSCARYHRVMQHGLELLRHVPEVRPSIDFEARLQHRVFHLQDEMWRHDRFATTGAAVSLLVAAMIALVAWVPVVLQELEEGRAGTAVANVTADGSAAAEEPGTIIPEPGLLPPSWHAHPGDLVGRRLDAVSSLNAAFPGPYSPLIVEPPLLNTRGARVVFTSLPGIE
jgi:hypothetical protein